MSSVWNFCTCFSDNILQGNQWWCCKISAVFLGYVAILTLCCQGNEQMKRMTPKTSKMVMCNIRNVVSRKPGAFIINYHLQSVCYNPRECVSPTHKINNNVINMNNYLNLIQPKTIIRYSCQICVYVNFCICNRSVTAHIYVQIWHTHINFIYHLLSLAVSFHQLQSLYNGKHFSQFLGQQTDDLWNKKSNQSFKIKRFCLQVLKGTLCTLQLHLKVHRHNMYHKVFYSDKFHYHSLPLSLKTNIPNSSSIRNTVHSRLEDNPI